MNVMFRINKDVFKYKNQLAIKMGNKNDKK